MLFLSIFFCFIENAYFLEKFSPNLQKELTKNYNDERSSFAFGFYPDFPKKVTNMMEALWNDEAVKKAEEIVNQICLAGNYSEKSYPNHYILVSMNKKRLDTPKVWAWAFYRDSTIQPYQIIQKTLRPEITELGCAVSICRNTSYAVCAHGKTNASNNCINYDNDGPICSKCPLGSKCTLDGLCSLRKEATNSTTRLSPEKQDSFVRSLNEVRTSIAIGDRTFDYNENGKKEMTKIPSAAKMMEVSWSNSAATIAESAMIDLCGYKDVTFDKGSYQLAVYEYYAKFYGEFDSDEVAWPIFSMSDTAWPLFLTSKYAKSTNYTDFFSWERNQMLSAREEITEVGCSFEYCRASVMAICAVGRVTCFSNCTIYEKDVYSPCSKCPKGSTCSFDGLCSFRKDATTDLTLMSKTEKQKILDRINDSRSKIAKGEYNISKNLAGKTVNMTMPSATDMMEIKWHDYYVVNAEDEMVQFCKYGSFETVDYEDKFLAWTYAVRGENSSRDGPNWNIPLSFFEETEQEWPLVITAKQQTHPKFSDVFERKRFDLFISWSRLSYIGCAMEYCRGNITLICSMGEFIECAPNCPIYQNGTTCSNCPEGTECAENGLCRQVKGFKPGKSGSRGNWNNMVLLLLIFRFFGHYFIADNN